MQVATIIASNIRRIKDLLPSGVKLVAVSKFKPLSDLQEAYEAGQRVFGESRPQEFSLKATQLPQDIEWHFIGHLQTNKLKLVLPYAHLVESVDSVHLLQAIEDWAARNGRCVNILLELHIGMEQTKQGFSSDELLEVISSSKTWPHVRICGLMGMASNTDDENRIAADFAFIKSIFDECRMRFPELDSFRELSIGMSGDWHIALNYGATIVRIGTAIFGSR